MARSEVVRAVIAEFVPVRDLQDIIAEYAKMFCGTATTKLDQQEPGWVVPLADRLVASTGDGNKHEINVWDIQTGELVEHHVSDKDVDLYETSTRKLASRTQSGKVCIWPDPLRAKSIALEGLLSAFDNLALSNGKWYASSDQVGNVTIWEAATGTPSLRFRAHNNYVTGILFLENGRLATCSLDKNACIWDIDIRLRVHKLTGHADSIAKIASLPNNRLATSCIDRSVRIWDTVTGTCVRELLWNMPNIRSGPLRVISAVEHLLVLPEARVALSMFEEGLTVWNVDTGRIVREFARPNSKWGVLTNGDLIECNEGVVTLWDVNLGLEMIIIDTADEDEGSKISDVTVCQGNKIITHSLEGLVVWM